MAEDDILSPDAARRLWERANEDLSDVLDPDWRANYIAEVQNNPTLWPAEKTRSGRMVPRTSTPTIAVVNEMLSDLEKKARARVSDTKRVYDTIRVADKSPTQANVGRVTLPDGKTIVASDPKTGIPITDVDEEGNETYRVIGYTSAGIKALTGGGAGGGGRARNPITDALNLARLEEIPGRMAGREASAAAARALEAQRLTALLPKQQVLLTQGIQTIEFIRDQVKAGNIGFEEADAYYTAVNDYVSAGMRGTTPWQEEKENREEARQRANIGKDLINQQVSSGSSLAAQLMGDYSRTITANGGILHPTGLNPIQTAKDTVRQLGGGDRTGRLAQALLDEIMPTEGDGKLRMALDYINGPGMGAVRAPQPDKLTAALDFIEQDYAPEDEEADEFEMVG